MKFLHLEFKHARLVNESSKSILFGSQTFFHPINKHHVYNVMCVLLDRTPKPQLRATDNEYMPFYDDVMDVVNKGYINTTLISDSEGITAVKKSWNSNIQSWEQLTWIDCKHILGTLLPIFLFKLSEILNETTDSIFQTPFETVIGKVHSKGIMSGSGEVSYSCEKINNLIEWLILNRVNSLGALTNYIKNINLNCVPKQLGKRINRGHINTYKYNGTIYIPLNEDLFDELIQNTKGHATILDDGLVKIIGYDELMEDDIDGFSPICRLNSSKKYITTFDKTKSVFETIYNNIDSNNLILSINKLISDVGVNISDNQNAYNSMMSKISKIDPKDTKAIANKLNFFIEKSINNQYK